MFLEQSNTNWFSNVSTSIFRGRIDDTEDSGWDFTTVRESAKPGPSHGVYTKGDVSSVKIHSILSFSRKMLTPRQHAYH